MRPLVPRGARALVRYPRSLNASRRLVSVTLSLSLSLRVCGCVLDCWTVGGALQVY